MDGDIKDDSIYSLGCKLCQRFSSETFSDKSGNKTKFLNFITSSEKEWKEKILLHRHKRTFFSILLKKSHNKKKRNDYLMPVTDQFYATAFELEHSGREENSQQLLQEFSKLTLGDSNLENVLQFLLQLKNLNEIPNTSDKLANIGISISKYGSKNGFYSEFPPGTFCIKLPEQTSTRYKQFTPEMFQKQLPYKNLLTLETKLGVDYDKSSQSVSSHSEHAELPSDEGYISPGPSDPDIWDECITGEGCKKMTWESLGKRTFQSEKPFLSESGTISVHNIWGLGKLSYSIIVRQ